MSPLKCDTITTTKFGTTERLIKISHSFGIYYVAFEYRDQRYAVHKYSQCILARTNMRSHLL